MGQPCCFCARLAPRTLCRGWSKNAGTIQLPRGPATCWGPVLSLGKPLLLSSQPVPLVASKGSPTSTFHSCTPDLRTRQESQGAGISSDRKTLYSQRLCTSGPSPGCDFLQTDASVQSPGLCRLHFPPQPLLQSVKLRSSTELVFRKVLLLHDLLK